LITLFGVFRSYGIFKVVVVHCIVRICLDTLIIPVQK